MPGLLSSGSEYKLLELLSCLSKLSPMVTVVARASEVSLALLLLLLGGTVLASVLVGTLDGTVPARAELTGNLDGTGLVSTLEGTVPAGFELVGNLEGTVLTSAEWAGTLEDMVVTGTKLVGEGTELVVTELVGAPSAPEQVAALAWSPAAFTEANPAEEEDREVRAGGTDTLGPGKRLALGVERAKGWKETVGDTGPWGDVGVETTPVMWVPPTSGSCS